MIYNMIEVMAVFTTEGIILKRSNYGEADRVLTIITPFKGKISVIARGVRKITSRRGGNVELLNRVRLQLFQGQGMPILSEAESIETFPKIKSDLILSTYASHVSELVQKLIPENQVNPTAYNLMVAILNLLEKNPRQIYIRAFELKLLSDVGFWSLSQIEASVEIKQILEKLETGSWIEIENLTVTSEQSVELERILRYYLERVLEGNLKSLEVISKLRQNK